MTEVIKPCALNPVTTYTKDIVNGILNILKEYCFEYKERTEEELDDAIRLLVLKSAYEQRVDIDVNEVVDSIYAEVDEFMFKWHSTPIEEE